MAKKYSGKPNKPRASYLGKNNRAKNKRNHNHF